MYILLEIAYRFASIPNYLWDSSQIKKNNAKIHIEAKDTQNR